KMDDSPRTPSYPYEVRKAAAQLGGSGCSGLLEYPLYSGSNPRKVAARDPLQFLTQPRRLCADGLDLEENPLVVRKEKNPNSC
ncbi:MAG: hypothetical protein IJO39_08850, partial [Clostridia bacterium]|nr:hypothetical protein [Clostridia bacterium]